MSPEGVFSSSQLAQLSLTPPKECHLDILDNYQSQLGQTTELHILYFPLSISQPPKEALENDKGICPAVGFGPSSEHMAPYRRTPARGWINEPQLYRETECKAMVWLHYWKDEERMTECKDGLNSVYDQNGEFTHHTTLIQRWQGFLSQCRIVGSCDELYDFARVSSALTLF